MEKRSLFFSTSTKASCILVLMLCTFSIASAQGTWILHPANLTTKCLHSAFSSWNTSTCFVCGDSGTILSSLNSGIWTKQQPVTTGDLLGITIGQQVIAGITQGQEMVAVGKNGTAISSSSGTSWHSQVSNTRRTIRALTWDGNPRNLYHLYVAIGDSGLIMTSPDDSTWTTQISGTTKRLNAVANSDQSVSFLAVGDSGTILSSIDGVTWTKQISGTTKNLNAVTVGKLCCGGTRMVTAGDSGTILTSPDGTVWSSQISGTTNTLFGIYCDMDHLNLEWLYYVTVGEKGTILTSSTYVGDTGSPPGVRWTLQTSGTSRNLYGITLDYDSLVAVGDSGTILTSYDFPYVPKFVGIKQLKSPVKQQLISITNNIAYYTLSESSRMSIKLYDTKGRCVKTLINRMQQPGSYSIALPHDILPGIYMVDFRAGNYKIDNTIVVSK